MVLPESAAEIDGFHLAKGVERSRPARLLNNSRRTIPCVVAALPRIELIIDSLYSQLKPAKSKSETRGDFATLY